MTYVAQTITNTNGLRKKQRESLEAFRPVVRKWTKLHHQYIGLLEYEENAFFYSEQNQVSMLATSAWITGGCALMEFSEEKQKYKSTRSKNTKSFSGKTDLWVYGDGYDFYVEAKDDWMTLDPNTGWDKKFEDINEKAYDSVEKYFPKKMKETSDSFHSDVLTACFFSFYLPKSKAGNYKQLRSKYIRSLSNPDSTSLAHLAGWYFLEEPMDGNSDKYLHVGTSVFFNFFSRANKKPKRKS